MSPQPLRTHFSLPVQRCGGLQGKKDQRYGPRWETQHTENAAVRFELSLLAPIPVVSWYDNTMESPGAVYEQEESGDGPTAG